MPDPREPTVELQQVGRQDAVPALPPLLRSGARSAGGAPDAEAVFLPAGYLVPKASFDVGGADRSTGVPMDDLAAAPDEVLVLELTDGSTLITSAAQLRASLAQSRPDLLDADGQILFERLRAEGQVSRGLLGDAVGSLVSKVFAVAVGGQPDEIIQEVLRDTGLKALEVGVSRLGTRKLMQVIEGRLDGEPGLYRWQRAGGQKGDLARLEDPQTALAPAAERQEPMLVFVHGTASNTLGSFGDLVRAGDRDTWDVLNGHFTGGIYALEHRTLSESPIDNALALAQALPAGAHLSLVSHSRGGLVADLLCISDFAGLIEGYGRESIGLGRAPDPRIDLAAEIEAVRAEQRARLLELAEVLARKRFVVQRYVRVASPARGTKLASGNFDVFLSGLLSVIGRVPFFFGSPLYAMFKRVVLEIAKNRTDPRMVPGIEAMLPDAPMARLLRDAQVRPDLAMSVIAGDIQGGHLLQRLGVLLTDFLIFENTDNDLVVDTDAMLTGIAPQAGARVMLDRGASVSHFNYFGNADTRLALRDWLVDPQPLSLAAFVALPARFEEVGAAVEDERLAQRSREALGDPAERPVVVVLPGVMGSHLWVGRQDRVWLDPLDIAGGGLDKLQWGRDGIEAEKLFSMFYGDLCEHLAAGHRVERFAYDWRQPLDVLGDRLGEFLDRLLAQTRQPVRLLAHSMGGLVVRAAILKRRSVMDALMQRDGSRLVMLGTPHQGSHAMVENLLGKGSTLRSLVRLDLKHDLQGVLDIVGGFRGALQLLPRPGFRDTFEGQDDGGITQDYTRLSTWEALAPVNCDFWFGNGHVAKMEQAALDEGTWLWQQDNAAGGTPALPADYAPKSVYVFGVAANTPCGVRIERSRFNAPEQGGGRLKMVGTVRGDGTVTWDSGRIGGIGSFYWMPAEHGDLPATEEHFGAINDLLVSGTTGQLATSPPAQRAIEDAQPVIYDAGPPSIDAADAIARGLMGGQARPRLKARAGQKLEIRVQAADLRFMMQPVLLGQYEQDPIAGPQKLMDEQVLEHDLSDRYNLGLYPGPLGSATAVLRVPNEQERRRGTLIGAVITGLGRYDGAIGLHQLTEAVRSGVLRYLLHVVDVLGREPRELPLASVLVGYNSSANLPVAASVEALVRGVLEANHQFRATTQLDVRVSRLDIVEIYLDTAITAVYELRRIAEKLAAMAASMDAQLTIRRDLLEGRGWRQRLFDSRGGGYWPRLIVTDADRPVDEIEAPSGPADARLSLDTARGGGAGSQRPNTRVADRLRYLYVGQRARAESVVQQRQPGLIESLVRQQIRSKVWQEDFSRMLFQLMVPHDFKDAARQLERVVIVVDAGTANLPWELMLADERRRDLELRPLAVRLPMVRQFATGRFRSLVRQSVGRHALVIGNPSSEGFGRAFADPAAPSVPPVLVDGRDPRDPAPLPGAEVEARQVAALLSGMGYEIETAIGEDRVSADVLGLLYRKAYRIVHVSAHGVFEQRHGDGLLRSGVVLSDGLLITAAEFGAMETVPELVFLNCCHLGQIEATVADGNRLAASVARELIQIGVRCVVVAGWAVSDDMAQLFGETFYRKLLQERQGFGQAVFEARQAAWRARQGDITWGAFQAYGDPSWRAEPGGDEGTAARSGAPFVSPDELLDELSQVATISRHPLARGERDLAEQRRRIEALKRRAPPGWLALPPVRIALAKVHAELQQFEEAREQYLAAIRGEDQSRVPVKAIEQLANMESRLGARDGGTPRLLDQALARLDALDALVNVADESAPAAQPVHTAERCALRGGTLKRKADAHARVLLDPRTKPRDREVAAAAMRQALHGAVEAYRRAEGRPGQPGFQPYNALNRLWLEALTPWSAPPADGAAEIADALAVARHCIAQAEANFAARPDFFHAVAVPEARLVERMIDGGLGREGEAGAAVNEEIRRVYDDALSNVAATRRNLDSVTAQMTLMSRLHDAMSVARRDEDPAAADWHRRVADRLIAIANRLVKGSSQRRDRPQGAFGAAAAPLPEVAPARPRRRRTAPPAATPAPAPAPAPKKKQPRSSVKADRKGGKR